MATLVGNDSSAQTVGDTSSVSTETWYFETGYTASATGTADTANIRIHTLVAGTECRIGVYDSGKNLLATSAAVPVSATGWQSATISVAISNGALYYLAIKGNGYIQPYLDSGGFLRGTGATSTYPTLPDPMGGTVGNSGGNNIAIYLSGPTSDTIAPIPATPLVGNLRW